VHLNIGKTAWRPELRPELGWGSLQRSPDPLASGEGAGCLRASAARTSTALWAVLTNPHNKILRTPLLLFSELRNCLQPTEMQRNFSF